MNGTTLPNPDHWVNLDHYSIEQIVRLWTRSTAPPAMGMVWAYLEWRRLNCKRIVEAAHAIDEGDLDNAAVSYIMRELVGHGIEFDSPTPHRPVNVSRMGEVRVL